MGVVLAVVRLSGGGVGGEGTYCRTRNSVRGVCAVQVEQDTGVVRRVRAGEGDTGRVRASTTGDTELIARDVELGTTNTAYMFQRRQLYGYLEGEGKGGGGLTSNVERNDLRTEKIVAGGDVCRDGDDLLAAVGVQRVGAPVVGADEPVLVDLEPAVAHVLGRVADLGEVGDDGAVVVSTDGLVGAGPVAGLLVHFDGDGSTGGHAADASDALVATDITLDVLWIVSIRLYVCMPRRRRRRRR